MPAIIAIEEIAQLLKYRDLRSVRKWLRSRNIPVIKLGKGEFTNQEIFETTLENILNRHKNMNERKGIERKQSRFFQSESEIKFKSDLTAFLNRANVVCHGN